MLAWPCCMDSPQLSPSQARVLRGLGVASASRNLGVSGNRTEHNNYPQTFWERGEGV